MQEDDAAKAGLVHARPNLPHDVATLDRVVDQYWLALVQWAFHLPEGDNDGPSGRVVVGSTNAG